MKTPGIAVTLVCAAFLASFVGLHLALYPVKVSDVSAARVYDNVPISQSLVQPLDHECLENINWGRLRGPLAHNDSWVVDVVRTQYLDPPSSLPYVLIDHAWYSQGKNEFTWPWIHRRLKMLFKGQRGGFFVEAGALDGEYLSNTLWLESELGWSGLLVEPDSTSYKALLQKHRKAWSSNACLSSKGYPQQVVFVSHFSRLKLQVSPWSYRSHGHELRQDGDHERHKGVDEVSYSSVQCFPLLTFLEALNVTSVDLLSLDIQGTEEAVIKHLLSSSSVSVRVILLENEHGSHSGAFLQLMKDRGYVLLFSALDSIFVKKDDSVLKRKEVLPYLQNTEE